MRPPLLSAITLTACLAAAPLASSQVDNFWNMQPQGFPGTVSTGWSSDFGIPPQSSGIGATPYAFYNGVQLAGSAGNNFGGPEIGVVNSSLTLDVPAQGSSLPDTVVHYQWNGVVQNLSTYYGMSASMHGEHNYIFSTFNSVMYYELHWQMNYSNSQGNGLGTLTMAIDLNGVSNAVNKFWSLTGPFQEEGTVSGIVASSDILTMAMNAGLNQGQGGTAYGAATLDVSIRFSSTTVPAVDVAYGVGKAGSAGVPLLGASTPMKIGSPSSLDLSNSLPSAPAWLIAGLSQTSLPFKGGTLLTSPDFVIPMVVPIGGGGSVPVPTLNFNGALGGITLFHQLVIADAGAAGAPFAMSNGLARTIGY